MRVIALVLTCFVLSGCDLWPYKSDFDCPHPEGEHCKLLYEIHHLTNTGKYDPDFIACDCGPFCKGKVYGS